jgi:long-chain acyl-CoA synthetase
MCYGIRPGCTSLVTTPLHHVFAQGMALATLRAGGAVVVMPRFDAESFLELVERHRVTTAQMVPTMFVRLMRLPESRRCVADVGSLEHVLHTGAPCPAHVKRAMMDWWGHVLWEQYGTTETGVVALASPQEWLDHPGTVGRAFLTSEIRIYDADGAAVEPGAVGDIYARMHGSPEFAYLGQPDATAAAIRDGLTRTGDLGYLDGDGFLFLADRSSDMVISGGVNVYPVEIEAVLLEHPAVRDAAVFGVPDEEYGEVVVADVEPEPLAEIDPDALRSFVAERLAGHKVPRRIRVVSSLPRDDSGKISKRKLREAYHGGD